MDCGADHDDFHEGEAEVDGRPADVRTASSEQVRQPIYRDALALWERYRVHLAPLEAVLKADGIPV